MAIPRGSRKITYSSEIRALKKEIFSLEQISIIQGSLLGDGCLHTAWAGTSKNYRFSKTHSIKQSKYVDWTYEKLKPFVLTPPALYKPAQSLKLRTISHSHLTNLRSIFYPNGKKILPKNIASIIQDPLSLAVWFMDDGNALICRGTLHGYHINTQSFTKKENEELVSLFKKIWNLKSSIQKNKGKYRIYIWSESISQFSDIVHKYMIPSMRYKLG